MSNQENKKFLSNKQKTQLRSFIQIFIEYYLQLSSSFERLLNELYALMFSEYGKHYGENVLCRKFKQGKRDNISRL